MTNHDKLSPYPVIAGLALKLGRPLRVLHIGNIANNAYNNARIQRQYGIEADVICYDYYHIMGCPEWEDGSFTGNVAGNFPDWFSTSLKGFSRPDWFVQGPADLCLQYLRAQHLGMGFTRRLMREYLMVNYWRILDDFAALDGRKRPPMSRRMRWVAWLVETMGLHRPIDHDRERLDALFRAEAGEKLPPDLVQLPLDLVHVAGRRHTIWHRSQDHLRQSATNLRVRLFNHLVVVPLRENRFDATGVRTWMLLRRMRGHARQPPLELAGMLDQELSGGARESKEDFERRMDENTALRHQKWLRLPRVVVGLLRLPLMAARWLRGLLRTFAEGVVESWGNGIRRRLSAMRTPAEWEARLPVFHARRNGLLAEAANANDEVQRQLKLYLDYLPLRFFDVMSYYDVIQGYSTDGFIPYMNGLGNFAAYEHGTIRDLPWEPSVSGIVAAKVYREAPLVFVTNSDVIPSVERLGLDPEKVIYLPHAFDDTKLRAFRAAHPELQPPPGPPVFFSPTRHHWKDKSGSWTKGNDIFIRAAGELLKEGHDFRLILVDWGQEVPDSRELIDSLGLTAKVTWVSTMQKRELWVEYCRAHAVVDQFTLPALGGVGFETMALGRRLVTALDHEQLERFFGEAPPCLAASTVDACAAQLRLVIADPADKAGRGEAAARWMQEYHSARRIVALQAAAYDRFCGMGQNADGQPLQ